MEENKVEEIGKEPASDVGGRTEEPPAAVDEPTAETPADADAAARTDEQGAPEGEPKKSALQKVWGWLKATVPGVALRAVLAVPAWFLG